MTDATAGIATKTNEPVAHPAETAHATEPSGRQWLRGGIRDVSLLFLGALLALAADTWRDSHQRANRVAGALASIRAELVANTDEVSRARTRHIHVVDTLLFYSQRHMVPDSTVYLGGIFNPGRVTSTAWESARETGVLADMDYRIVLKVAPAYEAQERYRALSEAVNESIIIDMRRDGVATVFRDRFAQFIPLARDFANRERTLANRYGDALAHLDSLTR
jgi:hypothetical protein